MRPLPTLALAAVTAAILAITLQPAPQMVGFLPVTCVFCGNRATADALANVILFLPLGAALAWFAPTSPVAWRYGILLSLLVELAQRFIAGRDASLGDVITNSAGTWLGWTVWRYVASSARRHLPASWPWAAGGFAAVVAGTVWLLQPALTTATYYGMWTPLLGQFEWYRGRVLEATLGGAPFRPQPQRDPAAIADFVRGRGSLAVRFIAGRHTAELAPLVSVFDSLQHEILLVGPDRDGLVLRYRHRAAEWRLDEPDVRFEQAARAWRSGDTLSIAVERTPHGACLTTGSTSICQVSVTPGRAWSLVHHPDSFPVWLRRALDLVWSAGLALLLGWCAGTRRTGIGSSVVVVAALAAVPPLYGSAPSNSGEILAALVGVWLGVGLRILVRWGR